MHRPARHTTSRWAICQAASTRHVSCTGRQPPTICGRIRYASSQAPLNRSRERRSAVGQAGQTQLAVIGQDALSLADHHSCICVRQEVEHVRSEEPIGARVCERDRRVAVRLDHADPASEGREAAAGQSHHRPAHVEADIRGVLRHDPLEQVRGQSPRPAAELHDRASVLEVRVADQPLDGAVLVEPVRVLPGSEAIVERPRLRMAQRPGPGRPSLARQRSPALRGCALPAARNARQISSRCCSGRS